MRAAVQRRHLESLRMAKRSRLLAVWSTTDIGPIPDIRAE